MFQKSHLPNSEEIFVQWLLASMSSLVFIMDGGLTTRML